MNLYVAGGLLGIVAALGVWLILVVAPPARRPTLSDRIAPYLIDTPAPSRLLSTRSLGTGTALQRILAPYLKDAVRLLDRIVGGRVSVEKRLTAVGGRVSVEDFRSEQLVWGGIGGGLALVVGLLGVFAAHVNPVTVVILVALGAVAGVFARDWWLSRTAAGRDAEMLAEFPVIAEMLALAVTAGEGPIGAIDRVTRLARGHLVEQLRDALADTHSGTPFLAAITSLRDRTRLDPLARFLDGMAVAIERGTPLADVLRAQAADVRALSQRHLLESGGKKEIGMMVPVVFVVLPITVVFALYPGLVIISAAAS